MPPKPDRPQQILKGALKAFTAPGYTQAGIKQIAHLAGITPGLIHYHFKDKQAVLEAVVEHIAHDMDQAIAQALESQLPLDAMLDVLLGVSQPQSAPLFACWQSLCAQAPCLPELSALLRPLVSHTHTALARALEVQERLTPTQALGAAATLLALIQGVLLIQEGAPGLFGDQVRHQVHLAARGIVFTQKMSVAL